MGIEFDSIAQEVRLPARQLSTLQLILRQWEGKRAASKRLLQSLIGMLHHAASVVRPGRTFLHHLINTMKVPKKQSHEVCLNLQWRSDIAWWSLYLERWNGVALLPSLSQGPAVESDASGNWGCGAFTHDSLQWFQVRWPPEWQQVNIAVKELFPVVVAATVWGRHWGGNVSTSTQTTKRWWLRCLREPPGTPG